MRTIGHHLLKALARREAEVPQGMNLPYWAQDMIEHVAIDDHVVRGLMSAILTPYLPLYGFESNSATNFVPARATTLFMG